MEAIAAGVLRRMAILATLLRARELAGDIFAADGGTLLLDDIIFLSPSCQDFLLQFLTSRTVCLEDSPLKVDVRIIAIADFRLEDLVSSGDFLPELYFSLSQVRIRVPPLRERKDDIFLLISHFLEEENIRAKPFSPEVMMYLSFYKWRNNVRELRQIVEYAFSVSEKNVIETRDLPDYLKTAVSISGIEIPSETEDSYTYLGGMERLKLLMTENVLRLAKGDEEKAAKALGISEEELQGIIEKHSIDLERFRSV